VWGGTSCANPYVKNSQGRGPTWSNSLFEDNAEYGLGMAIGVSQHRKYLAQTVQKALDDRSVTMSDELRTELSAWVLQRDDVDACEYSSKVINRLLEKEKDAHPLLNTIYDYRNYFIKLSHWIVGGDGWAYDIGSAGIDHVIAQKENVNILIMDTEVYSNTGGQMSKATSFAAVAKFAGFH
jgi:pyruvate-ferredoxin/flavodoxin oxidoreductase